MKEEKEYYDDIQKIFENFSENINIHRQENFISSILQHHTLKSTMYMSRWIEEKNRKDKD